VAKVTEKDIVEYLNEKITFHRQEALRLEGILNAFTQAPVAVQHNDQENTDVASTPKHPAKPPRGKRTSSVKTESKITENLEIPEKYTEDLTIQRKIAFALKEIGSGFKEDIANAMAQYEPRSDAEKIIKQIAVPLSNLQEQGKVAVEKVGRKYRFKLMV